MPVSSVYRMAGGERAAAGNASRAFALPATISYWNSNSTTYLITSYSAIHMKKKKSMKNTKLEKE